MVLELTTGLDKEYKHDILKSSFKKNVLETDGFHTNTIEGFFSQFETIHLWNSIIMFHLNIYIDIVMNVHLDIIQESQKKIADLIILLLGVMQD